MKICITSEGQALDSKVDPRFGRCRNFIFFDVDSSEFKARENANLGLQGGAGIQSAQLMASEGVKAVLTGNIGPNAHKVLSAAGISVFTGVSGTVKEAVEGFKKGAYKKADAPSVDSKFGASGSQGG